MNLADTLRGLWRRWYIVIPGLILAVLVALAAWQAIAPDYQRSGTQLLLPGTASIPVAGNPYLYLGGLSQASDVLITAMSSDLEQNSLLAGHAGARITIVRDPLTSGPQILTTVTARSDVEAGEILDAAIVRTTQMLDSLQDVDGITAGNRIGIKSITVDNQSTLIQKTRVLGVAGATLLVLLLTLIVAGLVEGLSTRKRRRRSSDSAIPELNDEESPVHDDVVVLPPGNAGDGCQRARSQDNGELFAEIGDRGKQSSSP
jgi:hypothetical protein